MKKIIQLLALPMVLVMLTLAMGSCGSDKEAEEKGETKDTATEKVDTTDSGRCNHQHHHCCHHGDSTHTCKDSTHKCCHGDSAHVCKDGTHKCCHGEGHKDGKCCGKCKKGEGHKCCGKCKKGDHAECTGACKGKCDGSCKGKCKGKCKAKTEETETK